jgi:hypothetical protein
MRSSAVAFGAASATARLTVWQAPAMELALVDRLREVVNDEPVTEAELRTLIEQADGLVRSLGAHVSASERRLEELNADPASSLTVIAGELHRVETLSAQLVDARSLRAGLERRARELRTAWLRR